MGNYRVLLISFFWAGIAAWVIARYGQRYKLVDYPSARSSHSQPVPKGAGSGIVLGFLTVALFLGVNILWWLPAVMIGLLGLVADRIEIAPRFRLFFQLLLALLFLLNITTWPVSFTLTMALVLLLLIYIVGTTNIYNFMDGINGIAAVTGVIGFFFLGCFALASGADEKLSKLLFAVAAACLGFLPFNFPRARVFMGDAGSTFLGFLFAGMVTYLARDISDFVVLTSFLFPFYADELTTMFVRIKDRENLTEAHRRHLYQLLANEGQLAHWQITLAYGAGQFIIVLMALWLRRYGPVSLVIMLVIFLGGFAALSSLVRKKLCCSIPFSPN
jgi:Fuc2NAc and GlcNAc transferase